MHVRHPVETRLLFYREPRSAVDGERDAAYLASLWEVQVKPCLSLWISE